MERITIYIVLDLTDAGARGPGWYTAAWVDNQQVIEPTQIGASDAYDAARALHHGIESSDDELPPNPLPDLVEGGSKLIRSALEKQLEYAQAQAAKIHIIQKKLNTLPKESHDF